MPSSANSNLASEFWFLAQLYRLGYEAYITLGNTKAVDIAVKLRRTGVTLTFDVKGKARLSQGSLGYLPSPPYPANHFFVFVDLHVSHGATMARFKKPDPTCHVVEASNLPSIALPWAPRTGGPAGFGFQGWILEYLKSGGAVRARSPKELATFKAAQPGGAIHFPTFQTTLMDLQDFEARFHSSK